MGRRYLNSGNAGPDWSQLVVARYGSAEEAASLSVHADGISRNVILSAEQCRDLSEQLAAITDGMLPAASRQMIVGDDYTVTNA